MNDVRKTPTWQRASIRLGTSAIILLLLFFFLPVDVLWATIRRTSAGFWLFILTGFLATHVIGIIKWRLVITAAGAELRFRQAAHCYLGGLFGAVFLPSIVGGDAIRVGLALRGASNRVGLLLGSLFDRVLDVTALLGLAVFSSLLLPGMLAPPFRRVFGFLSSPVAWGLLALLVLVGLLAGRWFSRRMHHHFAQLRQSVGHLSRQRRSVGLAFGLSLATQTGLIVLTALIAAVCGLHLPFAVWLFAFPLAKISALLPVTQGGIGVREVALSALLAPFGVQAAMAVAIGLVWESILIGGGLVAGLLSFLLGRAAVVVPGSIAWETIARPRRQDEGR